MSSKRRVRRLACKGKQQHATWDSAHRHMMQLYERGKMRSGTLNVYPCPFGNHFHVGHKPRKIA